MQSESRARDIFICDILIDHLRLLFFIVGFCFADVLVCALLLWIEVMAIASPIKEKRLIGAGIYFKRLTPLSSWQEAWKHVDRHGARKQVESSRLTSTGSKKKCILALA